MADPVKTGAKPKDDDRFPLEVVLFWLVVIVLVWWYLSNALGGKVPAQSAPAEPVEMAEDHASEEPIDWFADAQTRLADEGYDWIVLTQDGDTVTVSAEVESEDVKASAFTAAETEIMAAAEPAHAEPEIVNDISVRVDPNAWTGDLLAELNFDWLNLSASGSVATLSGTAPDAAARENAYNEVDRRIQANEELATRVSLLVNGIITEGEDAGETEALLALTEAGDDGLTVEECAAAFTDTMQGRDIRFALGSAVISSESARLLDALSGIATLCVNSNGHMVEIGGHTDSRGEDDVNQQLSEARANSVREYLIEKGVEGERLTSIGYGETQLLDPAETIEAHARNRRTEFKVVSAD